MSLYDFSGLRQMMATTLPAMQQKSWWPSYVQAQQSGDPNQVIAWANNVAPKFSDFDGATDGDFVGKQVASLQSGQADRYGINPNVYESAGKVGGTLGAVGLAASLGYAGGVGLGALGEAGGATTLAGDTALAGGGEVGSGYAASAPGATAGTAGGTTTAAGTQGGSGMWDWLDGMDTGSGNLGGGLSVDEYGNTTGGLFEGGPGTAGSGGFGQPLMPPAVPESDPTFGGVLKETSPGVFGQPTATGLSPTLLQQLGPALSKLLTSGGGGAKGGAASTVLGDPLGSAFNSLPFILALTEANRQSGDLNGVINKINSGFTDSVLHPYDQETGIGRTNMLQDLSLRGVSGSSFGNQQIGNYDYLRALGRGDLASKSNLASAGLEGNLINTRNTNRNMLLGAGLNASARLFTPQNDPFNLKNILGGP